MIKDVRLNSLATLQSHVTIVLLQTSEAKELPESVAR